MELTIREYSKAARRTINPNLTCEQTRLHALHGLASEVGEIHSIFQKGYQGHDVTKEKVIDELGDVAWMWNELCYAMQIDPQEVLEYNVDKLMKRYPDGFSAERSVNREEYKHG